MLKFSKILLQSILLLFLLFGCETHDELTPSKNSIPLADQPVLIAQVVSKSLEDADFRKLISTEAKRQFNQDYDVLFQMIKAKELRTNFSVMDLMIQNSNNKDIESMIDNFPLLTIFVPDLPNFSVAKWESQSEIIPKVAISFGANEDKIKVKVIDKDGQLTEVNRNESPSFPVVVLKNNERVNVTKNGEVQKGARKYNSVFSNNKYAFSFTTEVNNEGNANANARFGGWNSWGTKVQNAYTKSLNCSNCYHRDYIYYNISPTDGVTQGPFDTRYYETLSDFQFVSKAALQSVSSDFTEGNLELHFYIFFIGASNLLDKTEKVVWANPNSMLDPNQSAPLPFYVNSTIVPWKMSLYGDRWKIAVIEQDPGGTKTTTYSVTTTKGANFKADLSGEIDKIKVGIGFGASTQTQRSGSTAIQTTLTSNILGEAILNWFDPVIISKVRVGFGQIYFGESRVLDTGTIRFTIEPVGP